MTESEAKKLKVGDKVMWEKDTQDVGEVVEVDYCAVKIKWDNGQSGTVHVKGMAKIDRYQS